MNRERNQKSVLALQCTAIVLLTFVAGGATCIPKRSISEFQPKPVFDAPPTLDQLTEVLNRTRNIQSLQSNSVSVTLNNERAVNTNMTWAREKRFRMTASVAGVAGMDIGSNDEAFWLTMKNFGTTPQMYFAKHDEFEMQADRRFLPVSPLWLVQAMGICDIEVSQIVQQPVTRPNGLVELTSIVSSPIGNYMRTLTIDPKFGYTREVSLRDPTGRLVANSEQSKHQYYPSAQTSLPHDVKVRLIPALDASIDLDITVGAYLVNGLPTDAVTQSTMFAMPNMSAYAVTNLAQPAAPMNPQFAPPQSNVPKQSFRGVTWDGSIVR